MQSPKPAAVVVVFGISGPNNKRQHKIDMSVHCVFTGLVGFSGGNEISAAF